MTTLKSKITEHNIKKHKTPVFLTNQRKGFSPGSLLKYFLRVEMMILESGISSPLNSMYGICPFLKICVFWIKRLFKSFQVPICFFYVDLCQFIIIFAFVNKSQN